MESRMLLTEQDAVMKKWCPMIRLETKDLPPSEPRKGYCGLAGHALRVDCALMDRALRGAGPLCRYFDTVWAGGGSTPHYRAITAAESPQLSRNCARKIGK